jgi:hypothetical protein
VENTRLKQELATLRNSHAVERQYSPQNTSTPVNGEITIEQYHTGDSTGLLAHRRDMQQLNRPHTTEQQLSESMSTPPENAVSAEVGYLSLNATGETRYVGSSSGIGLASVISHMVDQATGVSLMPTEGIDVGANGPNNVAGRHFDTSVPVRRVAAPFIEAYFRHTHITFPLLHRTSFLRTVDDIYGDPDYYETHIDDAFVFDMVLSIGSSNFNRFGDASA